MSSSLCNQKNENLELTLIEAVEQTLSDDEKWLYLVFRNELRLLLACELEYEYSWKDHIHQRMTGCDPETLTMEFGDEDETRKDVVIERLIKRQKYNTAFDVATGSSFYFNISQITTHFFY